MGPIPSDLTWRVFIARHTLDHISKSPGAGVAARPLSFGASAIEASVVRNSPATEAAFCKARRVTLVGSRAGVFLNATIVCVDEDVDLVEFVRSLLTPEGFDVVTFSSASPALERIWERLPDLLTVDPLMTEGAGSELCQKSAHPTGDLSHSDYSAHGLRASP